MSLQLETNDVVGRVNDFTHDHYLFIYGIMKGIALGIAATNALPMFVQWSSPRPQQLMWVASVLAVMVSYVTTARGILLTTFRYSWLDVMIPLFMGMVECLLFLIIAPDNNNPTQWHYWYGFMALHMFCAFLLVLNRTRLTRSDDVATDLRPLLAIYVQWLKRDAKQAGLLCSGLTTCTIITVKTSFGDNPLWHYMVMVAIIGVMMAVTLSADAQRAQIVAFLQGPEKRHV